MVPEVAQDAIQKNFNSVIFFGNFFGIPFYFDNGFATVYTSQNIKYMLMLVASLCHIHNYV